VPKRTDLDSILIIGAGPIIIGQACEFDYSGAQACKALKEEGYRVILVNSNPATIMTDPETADAIYIEPINWRTIARIIEKERPTALLPTMGGQTALNTALDLVREGVLEKYNVEMIGASQRAIDMAEDRELFRRAMADIGLETARARIAHSMEEALAVQAEIGFPTVIRPVLHAGRQRRRHRLQPRGVRGHRGARSRRLADQRGAARGIGARLEGIRDGGGARPQRQLHHRLLDREPRSHGGAHRRLDHRGAGADADRQGVPALRDASIAVLRKIGVDTGGSNVQFAVNPDDGRVLVIEMNPRVSRSSALASKATGFPDRQDRRQAGVGYTLDELKNEITGGATPASFEPTIDYVVTKIPRFTFEKFPGAEHAAHHADEIGGRGDGHRPHLPGVDAEGAAQPGDRLRRIRRAADAAAHRGGGRQAVLRAALAGPEPHSVRGRRVSRRLDPQQVFEATKIDPWFLAQIEDLLREEALLREQGFDSLDSRACAR
jgi:carbamoyl-phosphate synthase large subunit